MHDRESIQRRLKEKWARARLVEHATECIRYAYTPRFNVLTVKNRAYLLALHHDQTVTSNCAAIVEGMLARKEFYTLEAACARADSLKSQTTVKLDLRVKEHSHAFVDVVTPSKSAVHWPTATFLAVPIEGIESDARIPPELRYLTLELKRMTCGGIDLSDGGAARAAIEAANPALAKELEFFDDPALLSWARSALGWFGRHDHALFLLDQDIEKMVREKISFAT